LFQRLIAYSLAEIANRKARSLPHRS